MQFSVMKALTFATLSVAFCCGRSEAIDAVRDDWVTNGRPVQIFKDEPRTDGKRVSVSVSNATRVDHRGAIHGVVFHVYLTNSTPKHLAVPASELLEFQQRAYMPGGAANPKSWFGDVFDDVVDFFKDVVEWAKRVRKLISTLRSLSDPIKESIRIVLELCDEWGIDIAEEIRDVVGSANSGEVVARYAANVKSAAHARGANGFGLPLNESVANAYRSTIQAYRGDMRARVVTGFHKGIMENY